MIPDYVDGTKNFDKKMYKAAIPLFIRAHDILQNVMPAGDNSACQHIVHKIAQANVRSGDIKTASAFLKEHTDQSHFVSIENIKNVQLFCSLGLLMDNTWHHRATILADITEDVNITDTGSASKPKADFSSWKPLLQVSHALTGLFEISYALRLEDQVSSVSALNKACKMLEHALNQDCSSLEAVGIKNNMGYCSVMKCHRPVLFHPDARNASESYADFFAKTIDDVYEGGEGDTADTDADAAVLRQKEEDLEYLVEAKVHWLDAVKAVESLGNDIVAGKVVVGREENAKLVISHATVLCNMAAVEAYVGRRAEANTHLSTAIKLLNAHFEACQSEELPVDSACRVLLAKILTMTASAHLHGTQAVTAEGLFRGSMGMLDECSHDHRCGFEKALTLHNYGKCLLKWEKREVMGAQYVEEARELMRTGASCSTTHRLFPCGIIVPCIL